MSKPKAGGRASLPPGTGTDGVAGRCQGGPSWSWRPLPVHLEDPAGLSCTKCSAAGLPEPSIPSPKIPPRAAHAPADARPGRRLLWTSRGKTSAAAPSALCKGQEGLLFRVAVKGPSMRNSKSGVTQGTGHRHSHSERQRLLAPVFTRL